MDSDKKFENIPSFTDWMVMGRSLSMLQYWSQKYDILIQFWGAGNNNAFISKDDVELTSMGDCETPLEVIDNVIAWCEKVNPRHKYPTNLFTGTNPN